MREEKGRTLTSVHEHESDGIPTVAASIEADTVVHADEATQWDVLEVKFPTKRINHS